MRLCLVRRSGVLASGQGGEPTPGDNPKVSDLVCVIRCQGA